MTYKIEYFTCKNFKFFYGDIQDKLTNKFLLNRKNLLLYGENGSGKSSIFAALYTLFSSSIKSEDMEVQRIMEQYRNIFSNNDDNCEISVCLSDDNKNIINREISNEIINTVNDDFTKKTLFSSDFISYKHISKIFSLNYETMDLFDYFKSELFVYIDLGEEYRDINGDFSNGKTMASDWWNYILDFFESIPKNTHNKLAKRSEEYQYFVNILITRFEYLFKTYIHSILEIANDYLSLTFKAPLSIIVDYTECDFSNEKDFYPPKILLKIVYNHELLNPEIGMINNLQLFLNEAKLTAIALSIRFAMLDQKINTSESGKILVIDDLLLSLDMSNRDIVLDILLKKTDEYQLILLTHDRYFYNLAKSRTSNLYSSSWIYKEMYQKQPNLRDIPVPHIYDCKSYMESAYKYLNDFDFPACANYLRKESESVLRKILPDNCHYTMTNNETKSAMLGALIDSYKKLCTNLNFDISLCNKLLEYKDLLLNPLSHDNIFSQIYKSELVDCMRVLEELNLWEKIIISNINNNENIIFVINDNHGIQWTYLIKPLEMFYRIKDNEGNIKYNNPNSIFISRSSNNVDNQSLNKTIKLRKGIKNIEYTLQLSKHQEISWYIDNASIRNSLSFD